MAKVMISLPDDLLATLDAQVTRRGTSRSALLQQLVEREVQELTDRRRARLRELLASAGPEGGRGTSQIRSDRARR